MPPMLQRKPRSSLSPLPAGGVAKLIAKARVVDQIVKGNAARGRKNWGDAAHHYRQALTRSPDLAEIWVQYGHALKEGGGVAEAEAAYRKAIALDDTAADFHLQLGHALKIQGRVGEALRAYQAALARAPTLAEAARELAALPVPSGRQKKKRSPPKSAACGLHLVFDISDLIDYFRSARLPTGIQRVQINIISAILERAREGYSVSLVCFTAEAQAWTSIPEAIFRRLVRLALAGGATQDSQWLSAHVDLRTAIEESVDEPFSPGAFLVNLGTSWWVPNYFLMVRNAKRDYGIRYVPFVHDCIPIVTPEYCVSDLVRDFIGWIDGVFDHADYYLVNSGSTLSDLRRTAASVGRAIDDVKIVPLDGSFGLPVAGRGEAFPAGVELARLGLDGERFVLLVATMEARKNHRAAFEAWAQLIDRRGAANVPKLVCVGKRGWMAEAALERLDADRELASRVVLLTDVSDGLLEELYRRCQFTLYPSFYEGWGLPVTESLCHGKVALVSRAASLPEAGGELAEYCDPNSADEIAAKAERLIDDGAYLAAREERIRRDFAPRSWSEIADDVLCAVRACASKEMRPALPPAARPRIYYSFARNARRRLGTGQLGAEVFRIGTGWWGQDDWGVWLKESRAELAFSLPVPQRDSRHLLYLGLAPLPESDAIYYLTVGDAGTAHIARARANRRCWARINISPEMAPDGIVRIAIEAESSCALAALTHGRDWRRVHGGVVGFYYCAADDVEARRDFVEAVQLEALV